MISGNNLAPQVVSVLEASKTHCSIYKTHVHQTG